MLVVLASGSGSNFESVAERFGALVAGVVCNVPGAGVISRAMRLGVPVRLVAHRDFSSRAEHETAIVESIGSVCEGPALVVLAGYMRVLSPHFFIEMGRRLPGIQVINLHPAPLWAYKGADGYGAAVAARHSRWALSVHEVTPELDSGPLLGQVSFPVFPWESASDLHRRVRPLEHALLNRVIASLLEKEPSACRPIFM